LKTKDKKSFSISVNDENNKKIHSNERREFFKKGLFYSVGLAAASNALASNGAKVDPANLPPNIPSWAKIPGKPVDWHPYGQPSPYEHNVIRRSVPFLSPDPMADVAFSPLQDQNGIITPNGLFFVRDHNGTCIIDPNDYRLIIHGLVDKPIILTLEEIKRYPSESRIHFIECPANGATEWRGAQLDSVQFTKGMLSCAQWTGVPLKSILKDLGLKPNAKWALAEGSDASSMARSIPIEKLLDDAMIVYAQNGEALRPEQGYPVRLIVPGWEGNLNVKWLRRIKIGDKPWHAKEETAKYTMLLPSGKAIQYYWVMDVNSVITSPCPEKPWKDVKIGQKIEIQGIAWSGRGRISAVDITFDGGKNWTKARLKGLILPKSFTRFTIEYIWDGKPIYLASRATDEVGMTQPTIQKLKKIRGVQGIYHRNSITTWEVKANGEVHNVQAIY